MARQTPIDACLWSTTDGGMDQYLQKLIIHPVDIRHLPSLTANRRFSYFDFLTDEELAAMNQAVKDGYNRPT